MIEINLLPQELHKDGAGTGERTMPMLSWRMLAGISVSVLLVVFLTNIFLVFALRSKRAQQYLLEQKWEQMLPALKAFEQKKKIQESFSRDSRTVAALSAARINWSVKLDKLGELLPAGIWFNTLTCLDKGLLLEASVFSPGKEIDLLNSFISDLKADSGFSSDFAGIELGAVNRENAGGYEIMNFVVNASIQRTARR